VIHKASFDEPQSRSDGKHPDVMIKDFTELLNTTAHETHWLAIDSGTNDSIEPKCHDKPYILHEQVHAIGLSIYNGIEVQA